MKYIITIQITSASHSLEWSAFLGLLSYLIKTVLLNKKVMMALSQHFCFELNGQYSWQYSVEERHFKNVHHLQRDSSNSFSSCERYQSHSYFLFLISPFPVCIFTLDIRLLVINYRIVLMTKAVSHLHLKSSSLEFQVTNEKWLTFCCLLLHHKK